MAVLYHNPMCSNSRQALAVLRARGVEPVIVEYLKTPLTKDQLRTLVTKMGVPGEPGESERSSGPFAPANAARPCDQARPEAGTTRVADIVRWKEKEAVSAAGITPESSDEALLDAMAAHPVLMNRPIVITDKGARLCRPGDTVSELL